MRRLAFFLCCGVATAHADLRLDVPADLAARLRPHLAAESGERRLRQTSTDILATEGYFSPQIAIDTQGHDLLLRIDPGPRTHISSAEVEITGAVTPERLAALRERWLLPVGRPFRQEDWNNAKNQLLSDLLAEEHAAARLLDSLADIDPDTQRAALQVSYDAGPRYRYGELEIDGLYRFRPELVARYNADVRPGKVYRAEEVQALVHALQSSPYFATVRGELDLAQAVSDGEADSLRAPVRLTVQEQPVHRARFGVGASSNTGARVEASYSTIDFLRQAWELDTGVRLEEKRQTFYSDVFLPPMGDGVRYGAGFVAEQSDIEQLRIQRQSVGVQRIEQRGRLEERLSLNWQHEKRQPGDGDWTTSRALVPNVTWTWRKLDQMLDPRRGVVLQLSVGGGAKKPAVGREFPALIWPQPDLSAHWHPRYLEFAGRVGAHLRPFAPACAAGLPVPHRGNRQRARLPVSEPGYQGRQCDGGGALSRHRQHRIHPLAERQLGGGGLRRCR